MTTTTTRCQSRQGFSLVELLVVVVIIGLLASVGFISYQAYITTSRDSVSESNWDSLRRMLEVDEMAMTSGINARSTMSQGTAGTSNCKSWKSQVMTEMNRQKDNPFGGANVAIDGNLMNTPPNGTITWNRGQMLVACADECAAIDSADFALQVCVCTEEETCTTSEVDRSADVCTTPPAARTC